MTHRLPAGIHGHARFSECGRYRYLLSRWWDAGDEPVRSVCFCGLNPSKAGHNENDATIAKLTGFAQRWGFNRLFMVNLYGWIETKSTKLFDAVDPIGAETHHELFLQARSAHRFVACLGAGASLSLEHQVLSKLRPVNVWAFWLTKSGRPGHPLYLSNSTEPFVWKKAAR